MVVFDDFLNNWLFVGKFIYSYEVLYDFFKVIEIKLIISILQIICFQF